MMNNRQHTTETFEFTKRKIAIDRIALAKRLGVIAFATFVSGAIGFAWSDSATTFGTFRMAFLGVGGAIVGYLLTTVESADSD